MMRSSSNPKRVAKTMVRTSRTDERSELEFVVVEEVTGWEVFWEVLLGEEGVGWRLQERLRKMQEASNSPLPFTIIERVS